jgi:hypothetical protein
LSRHVPGCRVPLALPASLALPTEETPRASPWERDGDRLRFTSDGWWFRPSPWPSEAILGSAAEALKGGVQGSLQTTAIVLMGSQDTRDLGRFLRLVALAGPWIEAESVSMVSAIPEESFVALDRPDAICFLMGSEKARDGYWFFWVLSGVATLCLGPLFDVIQTQIDLRSDRQVLSGWLDDLKAEGVVSERWLKDRTMAIDLVVEHRERGAELTAAFVSLISHKTRMESLMCLLLLRNTLAARMTAAGLQVPETTLPAVLR